MGTITTGTTLNVTSPTQANLYVKGNTDSSATWVDRHSTSNYTGIAFTTNGSQDYFLHEGPDGALRMGASGNELSISGGVTAIDSLAVNHGIAANEPIRPGVYTVSTLPSASTRGVGAQAMVTDANAPSYGVTVSGGGAAKAFVISDGSNWIVH